MQKKINLIYQGLELDSYAQVNIDRIKMKQVFQIGPDEKVIGMIGRLEPVKGPAYFIEAAKIVAEQFAQAKFILVGEGSLRRRLERRIEEAGLRGRFILTGWREDIPQVLSMLDLLILPSLNEAVGIVLIEAQALGIPVIASCVGGVPEIVKDNQAGILVPPGNIRDLARAINYLLADEQKRQEMGQKAKAWVEGRFRVEDMVNGISQLYRQLINEKKMRRK